MPDRKDVSDRAAAPLSMPRPLVLEMNPMNHAPINKPASRENDIPFRYGLLLPKLDYPISSRPSIDLFVMTLAPATNPYPDKMANKAPDSSACR